MAAISSRGPCVLRSAFQAFSRSHPLRISHRSVSSHGTLSSFALTTPIRCSRASGVCHVAQAIRRDVDDLLKGVTDKTTTEEVKYIIEVATRVSSRREVLHTDFLTPPVLKESMIALEKLSDVKAVAQGGYPQDFCWSSEALTSDPDIISALSISGNFGFEPCSRGDFLGAILGTGIAREKLGDIILQNYTRIQSRIQVSLFVWKMNSISISHF